MQASSPKPPVKISSGTKFSSKFLAHGEADGRGDVISNWFLEILRPVGRYGGLEIMLTCKSSDLSFGNSIWFDRSFIKEKLSDYFESE
jgi:hypothetical protein